MSDGKGSAIRSSHKFTLGKETPREEGRPRYQLKDHIQPLEIAPRAENVLDQREITIQSYQTTIPFDYHALEAALESAWLKPALQLGVFLRPDRSDDSRAQNHCVAILGLQDSQAIRAYDYDARRPLWFSWQNAVVDTVNIRYFKGDDGLLRFTTTGGGRRITEDRLQAFNTTFLNLPREAVSKLHFDLAKLRQLCFSRFVEQLYMVRFSDPSGEEYRSIDHALFQSRKYIDPDAKRLKEVRADKHVKIESFDSEIPIESKSLAKVANVRFFIRGLSGSLRLRFPKLVYSSQLVGPEEQARVFYELVDTTVAEILDADYYGVQPLSLDAIDIGLPMFPDVVDLAPFRRVLLLAKEREEFFRHLDLGEHWTKWQPHLRALDELLTTQGVADQVETLVVGVSSRDPLLVARLLEKCLKDGKTHRLGDCVAKALVPRLQAVPATTRAHVEEMLLSWALQRDDTSWDVDPESGEISAAGLRWPMEHLSLDALAPVLSKLVGVLHTRLTSGDGELGSLIARFNWCMAVAKGVSPAPANLPASLRLVASDQVPASVAAGDSVLKEPVRDLQSLDDAVLEQFGLPLWPSFTASGDKGKITLLNDGVGIAHSVAAAALGTLFGQNGEASTLNLAPGESTVVSVAGKPESLDVRFSKYGRSYLLDVPINYSKKSHVRAVDKQLRKRGKRDAIIGALKAEVRQFILSMKSAIRQADDSEKVFELPRLTQKNLAKAISATEAAVSRALKDRNERELPILFRTAQCVDQIRAFKG